MTRLEAILEQMQQPETTLAESVKLYAEAASLMDYCNGTLEKAKARALPDCATPRSTVRSQRQVILYRISLRMSTHFLQKNLYRLFGWSKMLIYGIIFGFKKV